MEQKDLRQGESIERGDATRNQNIDPSRTSITPTSNSRVGEHSGMTSEQIWAFLENEKKLSSTREGRLAQFHRDSIPYSRDVTREAVEKGFGGSYLDDYAVAPEQITNIEDFRGTEQSGATQIGLGVGKGLVLAGTTFVDGTAGFIYGIGQGIYNAATKEGSIGRNFLNGMWDNAITRAMSAVNERAEAEMVNYSTIAQQNKAWYENLGTANFWGDTVLKNAGFMVGAIGSGGVHAALFKGAAYLLRLGKAVDKIAKASKLSQPLTRAHNFKGATQALVGSATAAVGEGSIEALDNSKQWFESNKRKLDDIKRETTAQIEQSNLSESEKVVALQKLEGDYNDMLVKLEENRINVGNQILSYNVPILTLSNLFQFGKLFCNGFNPIKRHGALSGYIRNNATNTTILPNGKKLITKGKKAMRQLMEKDADDIVDWTKRKGKLALGKTAKALSKGLAEGSEEVAQKVASTSAGIWGTDDVWKYYKAKHDPEAAEETMSKIESIRQGMKETFSDVNTGEEFFVGALFGLVGLPMFTRTQKKNEDGSIESKRRFTMTGGIFDAFEEYKRDSKLIDSMVTKMNEATNKGKWKTLHKNMIRENVFSKDMEQAVANDEMKEFKDAEHAAYISAIHSYLQAGKLADLKGIINIAIPEDIDKDDQSLLDTLLQTAELNETQDVISYIGDITRQASSPIESIDDLTEDEKGKIVEYLKKSKKQYLKEIKDYVQILDNVSSTFPGFSDEQVEHVAWLRSMADNWKQRSGEIIRELPKREIFDWIDKKIKDFTVREESATLNNKKEEAEKYKKGIENLSKVKEQLNNISSITEQYKEFDLLREDEELEAFLAFFNEYNIGEMFNDMMIDWIQASSELNDKTAALNMQRGFEKRARLFDDLIKISRSYGRYLKTIHEYNENPEKVKEDLEVAQRAVENENRNYYNRKLKNTFIKAKNPKELIKEYRDALNSATSEEERKNVQNVLKQLVNEGNENAKVASAILEKYNAASRRINSDESISPENKKMLLKILEAKIESSSTLEDFYEPIDTDTVAYSGEILQARSWFNDLLESLKTETELRPLGNSTNAQSNEKKNENKDTNDNSGEVQSNPTKIDGVTVTNFNAVKVPLENNEKEKEDTEELAGDLVYNNAVGEYFVKDEEVSEHREVYKKLSNLIDWDYIKQNIGESENRNITFGIVTTKGYNEDPNHKTIVYLHRDKEGDTPRIVGILPFPKENSSKKIDASNSSLRAEIDSRSENGDYKELNINGIEIQEIDNLESTIHSITPGTHKRNKGVKKPLTSLLKDGKLPEGAFFVVQKTMNTFHINGKYQKFEDKIDFPNIPYPNGTIFIAVPTANNRYSLQVINTIDSMNYRLNGAERESRENESPFNENIKEKSTLAATEVSKKLHAMALFSVIKYASNLKDSKEKKIADIDKETLEFINKQLFEGRVDLNDYFSNNEYLHIPCAPYYNPDSKNFFSSVNVDSETGKVNVTFKFLLNPDDTNILQVGESEFAITLTLDDTEIRDALIAKTDASIRGLIDRYRNTSYLNESKTNSQFRFIDPQKKGLESELDYYTHGGSSFISKLRKTLKDNKESKNTRAKHLSLSTAFMFEADSEGKKGLKSNESILDELKKQDIEALETDLISLDLVNPGVRVNAYNGESKTFFDKKGKVEAPVNTKYKQMSFYSTDTINGKTKKINVELIGGELKKVNEKGEHEDLSVHEVINLVVQHARKTNSSVNSVLEEIRKFKETRLSVWLYKSHEKGRSSNIFIHRDSDSKKISFYRIVSLENNGMTTYEMRDFTIDTNNFTSYIGLETSINNRSLVFYDFAEALNEDFSEIKFHNAKDLTEKKLNINNNTQFVVANMPINTFWEAMNRCLLIPKPSKSEDMVLTEQNIKNLAYFGHIVFNLKEEKTTNNEVQSRQEHLVNPERSITSVNDSIIERPNTGAAHGKSNITQNVTQRDIDIERSGNFTDSNRETSVQNISNEELRSIRRAQAAYNPETGKFEQSSTSETSSQPETTDATQTSNTSKRFVRVDRKGRGQKKYIGKSNEGPKQQEERNSSTPSTHQSNNKKTIPLINLAEELAWLEKTLPQLSAEDRVMIVHGLIRKAYNGSGAWGKYVKGVISVSDLAKPGTLYHEAFHAVFDTMLSNKEKEALYEEVTSQLSSKEKQKIKELMERGLEKEANIIKEEWLANSFQQYVLDRQREKKEKAKRSLPQKILDFFKYLFNLGNLFKRCSRDGSINLIFDRINKGYYSRPKFDKTIRLNERIAEAQKYDYARLTNEQKEDLKNKGISKEFWEKLHPFERTQLLDC